MSKGQNDSKSRGSLRQQIRSAAKQVNEHRQAVSFHRAALAERLHERLTAPSTLLFAVGTGFVIGEFTSHGGSARESEQESGRRSKSRAKAALVFAFKMFTLAHAAPGAVAAPSAIQNGP